MKKMACLALTILILCCTAACSRVLNESDGKMNDEYNEDVLSKIYEINDQILDAEIENDSVNHRNVIFPDIEVSYKKDVGEKTAIRVLEKSMNLIYQETEHHPIGDIELHKYCIEGVKNSRVLLREDGSIQEIVRGNIAKLDISPKESPESVQRKLEVALGGMVDFSLYQHSNVEPALKSDGTYHSYSFSYYNEINGYTSDVLYLLVEGKGDGTVRTLRYNNPLPQLTEQDLQISKSHEDEILQIKLKDMYNVESADNISYEVVDSDIVMYNGEGYIKYRVYTDVLRMNSDVKDGYVCDLLISLQLLTES